MKKYILALLLIPTIAYAGMFKNLYPTWNDVLTPALAARVGATAPAFKVFRGNIYALAFEAGATNEEVHFNMQFPHSYKAQSNMDVHLHTACTATGVGGNNTVEFCLEYLWVPVGGVYSSTPTTTCRGFVVGNAYTHAIWDITDVAGIQFGTGVSSMFVGRVYRNRTGGGTTDNYTSDVFVQSIDIHFVQDASGSWSEYSK